ncbi:MAG: hypothetical protein A2289_22065 [Deltaproteobacteria bacterium RIFOXYA12_FULL_58_15]|nr:MAG: hypothetical protein A2289_22065 [Deltaproteobacteria bacterium RIFOXYA12_FULL_58_15]
MIITNTTNAGLTNPTGNEFDRSTAWTDAVGALKKPIDFKPTTLRKLQLKPGEVARINAIAGKGTLTPKQWGELEKDLRAEIAQILDKAGVAVADVTIDGLKARRAGGDQFVSSGLDLGHAKYSNEIPFNIFYNTINPGYLSADLLKDFLIWADAAYVGKPELRVNWEAAKDACQSGKLSDAPAGLKQLARDFKLRKLEGFAGLDPAIQNALIYYRIREALDPNHRAPLTSNEWAAMTPEFREEVLQLLQCSGFSMAMFQRPQMRVSNAGRTVQGAAVADSGLDDDRVFELTSSIVSTGNIVREVASRPLNRTRKLGFDATRLKMVREAQRFVIARYYGFERDDFTDELIAAARRGCKVEVEMQPPATAANRRGQFEQLKRLEEAIEQFQLKERLSVSTATVIEPRHKEKGREDFPAIAHDKSLIVDTPEGTLAELHGGINGGPNSPNNLDVAIYVEGPAVLDGVRRYLAVRSTGHTLGLSVGEEVIAAFSRDELIANTAAKAKKTKQSLVKIAVAGSGERFIPKPQEYSADELVRRAEAGLTINLSVDDVVVDAGVTESGNPRYGRIDEMEGLLLTALNNGSAVNVSIPHKRADGSAVTQDQYMAIKSATALFRKLGARIAWEDTRIRDVSYRNEIYDNLKKAIERKESFDGALFAFTDAETMSLLAELHRTLERVPEEERPKIRIAVHALEIDDKQVNQKMVALRDVGVDVRVFTPNDAVLIAAKLAKEFKMKVTAEDVKLHAKCAIFGLNAAGGNAPDPRVASGSSNFSKGGFEINDEGGRIYFSKDLATSVTARVFDEIFALCRPVRKHDIVPLHLRKPVLKLPKGKTPLEKVWVAYFDTETGGTAPHFGDPLTQLSCVVNKLEREHSNDGGTPKWKLGETVGTFDEFAQLGVNAFGLPEEICAEAARVHGMKRKDLESGLPRAELLRRFVRQLRELEKKAAKEGAVLVLAAHNAPFDVNFLDFNYSQRSNHVDGHNCETATRPVLDTLVLAKEQIPFIKKEDRSQGEERISYSLKCLPQRLGIKHEQGEIHNALEDVSIGAEVVPVLATMAGAEFLEDLYGRDRLVISTMDQDFELYDSPRGDKVVQTFRNRGKNPRLAEVVTARTNGQNVQSSPHMVYDHRVLEAQDGRIKVEFRMNTKGTKTEKWIAGWVPVEQVRFYRSGKVYWGLVESGVDVQIAASFSRGEYWRNDEGRLPNIRQKPSSEADRAQTELENALQQLTVVEDDATKARREADIMAKLARAANEDATAKEQLVADINSKIEILQQYIATIRNAPTEEASH